MNANQLLDETLSAAVRAALAGHEGRPLGVAVSGGSDSTALLLLLADWARHAQVLVRAVSVDHGLRSAAAAEARAVAQRCQALDIPHDTLRWQGWDGRGNTQDQARRARYGLMADWARTHDLGAIALGHTADDQAETFLMRLARGSGVDGLSGMAPERHMNGVMWLRPLLGLRREMLREMLRTQGVGWVDDPTNEDTRYQRVRVRQALALLAPLGVSTARIADTAARLRTARGALEAQTQRAARGLAQIKGGDVVLQRAGFLALLPETRSRLLSHAVCWVASASYRPRRKALERLEQALIDGRAGTLSGCRVIVDKTEIRVFREYAAVQDNESPPDQIWDGRWQLSGPLPKVVPGENLRVRALGDAGLRACDAWRASGLGRASLLASPALWSEDQLLAAPLAGFGAGWRADLCHGADDFYRTILSH